MGIHTQSQHTYVLGLLAAILSFVGADQTPSSAVPAIRRISVIGERHSGTNYVRRLLISNLAGNKTYDYEDHFSETTSGTFGAKHCHPYPRPDELGQGLRFPDKMEPTYKDALAVVVVRNPYDWAIAMHKECWCDHAESMAKLPFDEFLKVEMADVCVKPWKGSSKRNQVENCPHIMACRAAKHRSFFNLKRWAPNVEVVRHEDILTVRQAEKWMRALIDKYRLKAASHGTIVPVHKYKDTDSDFNVAHVKSSPWFQPKQLTFNATLRRFVELISQYMDVDAEVMAGYHKINLTKNHQ